MSRNELYVYRARPITAERCVNPSSVDREREPVGWMNITAARMHIEHSVATFYGE